MPKIEFKSSAGPSLNAYPDAFEEKQSDVNSYYLSTNKEYIYHCFKIEYFKCIKAIRSNLI